MVRDPPHELRAGVLHRRNDAPPCCRISLDTGGSARDGFHDVGSRQDPPTATTSIGSRSRTRCQCCGRRAADPQASVGPHKHPDLRVHLRCEDGAIGGSEEHRISARPSDDHSPPGADAHKDAAATERVPPVGNPQAADPRSYAKTQARAPDPAGARHRIAFAIGRAALSVHFREQVHCRARTAGVDRRGSRDCRAAHQMRAPGRRREKTGRGKGRRPKVHGHPSLGQPDRGPSRPGPTVRLADVEGLARRVR